MLGLYSIPTSEREWEREGVREKDSKGYNFLFTSVQHLLNTGTFVFAVQMNSIINCITCEFSHPNYGFPKKKKVMYKHKNLLLFNIFMVFLFNTK